MLCGLLGSLSVVLLARLRGCFESRGVLDDLVNLVERSAADFSKDLVFLGEDSIVD